MAIERPIIFSGPMVRAILEGRKIQTRRIVRKSNSFTGAGYRFDDLELEQAWVDHSTFGGPTNEYLHAPIVRGEFADEVWDRVYSRYAPAGCWDEEGESDYCPPATRLWARETWAVDIKLDAFKPSDMSPDNAVWYPATPHTCVGLGKMRRSIHMPRWASRIMLDIKAVRVERLRDISERDAVAEGASGPMPALINDEICEVGPMTFIDGFADIWEDIHGHHSWHDNPWVWVIEFERADNE